MDPRIFWTARCAYPGHSEFLFYSPSFVVASWADLDTAAQTAVAEEWAKISPYPAPPIVELIPGAMSFQTNSHQ